MGPESEHATPAASLYYNRLPILAAAGSRQYVMILPHRRVLATSQIDRHHWGDVNRYIKLARNHPAGNAGETIDLKEIRGPTFAPPH